MGVITIFPKNSASMIIPQNGVLVWILWFVVGPSLILISVRGMVPNHFSWRLLLVRAPYLGSHFCLSFPFFLVELGGFSIFILSKDCCCCEKEGCTK